MSRDEAEALARRPANGLPVIDGRRVRRRAARRLRWRLDRLAVSADDREEAELERRLRGRPAVTRPNVLALLGAKSGVGTTTGALIIGSLLAGHLRLRAIVVETRSAGGGLAWLAPASRRSERSLADLLEHLDELHTAAELNPYVSRLPIGLHVLASPPTERVDRGYELERSGALVAFLSCFYEVVLLDCGIGLTAAPAQLALERADQLLLVTTPEWLAATPLLEAVAQLPPERSTVLINKSHLRAADVSVIEERWRGEHGQRTATIPYDEQLAGMLATGTYTLDALAGATRHAIKRLGLGVAERLV
jgi:MinD-like ATPase involved in chromosome partitioning or flagellar assembly